MLGDVFHFFNKTFLLPIKKNTKLVVKNYLTIKLSHYRFYAGGVRHLATFFPSFGIVSLKKKYHRIIDKKGRQVAYHLA